MLRTLVAAALLAGLAAPARAGFITYTFTGTVTSASLTPTVGGPQTAPADAVYTITLTGDTAGYDPTFNTVPLSAATVAVTGLGAYTLPLNATTSYLTSVQTFGGGVSFLFTTPDATGTGSGGLYNPVLATYDPRTATGGPVTNTRTSNALVTAEVPGGFLSLFGPTTTFEATLVPDGPGSTATPLPATALAFAPALAGLLLARRRRVG